MVVPVNAINERLATRLLAGMRRWRGVEVLDGYPSALAYLAHLGSGLGIAGPAIPLVISTAERLEPAQRSLIAAYFRARVVDQYAASEPSIFAGECEHGSLHVFPQSGICEFEPLPGENPSCEHLARVIMTPFHNKAQVLLRYAIGDLARVVPNRQCGCGRRTPIIASVEGRAADVLSISTPHGVLNLTSALLSTGFYGFPAVRRGQIVQTGPAAITIRCELERPLGEGGRRALLASFTRVCGAGVAIAIDEVATIPPGRHGKFPFVVPLVRRNESP
jgi:phenylacetate-CoA ligase